MRQSEKENKSLRTKKIKAINLNLDLIGEDLLDEIRKFEPYGPAGFPIFSSLVVSGKIRLIGKDKSHLEMRVCCIESKHEIRSIGWKMG